MPTNDSTEAPTGSQRSMDRRSLLRRGGTTVAAGVAGLAVANLVDAGAASAAAGGNAVLGQSNDAGTATTTLTSAVGDAVATPATLDLVNTGGGAPLHLQSQALPAAPLRSASDGNLANFDGGNGADLYSTTTFTDGAYYGFLYNQYTANQIVPINRLRVLDTRTVNGRRNIVNPGGNLDSAGRLLNTHTIRVSLAELVVAPTAVFANLTAVNPLSAGYLLLYAGGARPVGSSINFTANALIANFAITGATYDATNLVDTVSIFTLGTTHVLLDVVAFSVGSPGQVNPAYLPGATPAAARAQAQSLHTRVKAGRVPDWYQAH